MGTRYIDIVLLAPLLLSVFMADKDQRTNLVLFRKMAVFSIILIISSMLLLYAHHKHLGNALTTPYDSKVASISRLTDAAITESSRQQIFGRDFSKVFTRVDQVVCDSIPYTTPNDRQDQLTVIKQMPYLLLAPSGLILLVRRNLISNTSAIFLCLSLLLWVTFYSTAWFFTAHDIFYGCQRYLSGWLLPLGLVSFYAFTSKSKQDYVPSLAALLFVYSMRYVHKYVARVNRLECLIQVPSQNITLKSSDLNRMTSVSGPFPRHPGIPVKNTISIRSCINDELFSRFEIAVESSNDAFFPQKISLHTGSHYGALGIPLTGARLSRENHIWEIKLPNKVRSLYLKIEEDSEAAFRIHKLNAYKN